MLVSPMQSALQWTLPLASFVSELGHEAVEGWQGQFHVSFSSVQRQFAIAFNSGEW
jgi:hypothetical protein